MKIFKQPGFWLGMLCAALLIILLQLAFNDNLISFDTTITGLLGILAAAALYIVSHGHKAASNAQAEITLQSINEGVITTDTELRVTHLNPFAGKLTGWKHETALGQPLSSVLRLINETTREAIDCTTRASMLKNCTLELEQPAILISRDEHEHCVEVCTSPIEDSEGKIAGGVVVFRDITHIREMSKKMEFQAKHDSLTNLINRREFEQKLKHAIISARDNNHIHALCYMDLDQFKIVNDTCGHIAGDQLLREISKLMPFSIRSSDCLARLGGDEFGVIMFDCPMDEAANIAEDLRTAISDFKFTWDKKIFDIGASIGLVAIDATSGSLQDVMRRADASCYIAKDFGRNRMHIYKEDDLEHARRRGEMQWLTKIHNTFKEERFKLAIQAVKPIDNKSLDVHYEVLLRMVDEEGNTVSPASFLPAAERFDMMPVIDKWVITTSLHNIMKNPSRFGNAVFNINLSGQTLRDESILAFINEQIDNYRIPAKRLCFEITETAAIANLGFAIELINELKAIGCQFALDDFGSGLSSFAYLKKLPVDYLKIDGAFVRDAVNNQQDLAIVTAINTIGHEMKLKTVAEYVNNDETLSLMKQLGVNYAQGFMIDKPVDWAEH